MDVIEKTVSNFIENSFPEVYREEGPLFVFFVKCYYEWMESQGNPIYHSRHFLEYRDIDETPDEFLVYFKEMYLKNISITSAEGTRTLVKHSLDLYRSKGTEQGLDLLFRAEYGVPAKVYYPSTDLFKLSSGKWIEPKYIQITLSDDTNLLEQKEIIGNTSGAVAFVEKAVRKFSKGRLVDVLYLSAIYGTFLVDEFIRVSDDSVVINPPPFILGSITGFDLDISGSGQDFKVGDIVSVFSDYGEEAEARVTSVKESSGQVGFGLDDGGYGYTANTKVYTSEKVLALANVVVNTNTTSYLNLFEGVTQPYAKINYLNKVGNSFAPLDTLYTYTSNVVTSQSTVLSVTETNSTAGSITYAKISGNLSSLAFYKSGNAISANVNVSNTGYVELSGTANVIGVSNTITLTVGLELSGFVQGEEIYQMTTDGSLESATATISKISTDIDSITVSNVTGCFRNATITGRTSNTTTTIVSQAFSIGVINVNNSFTSLEGNVINAAAYSGVVRSVSLGSFASVNTVANTLIYTEVIPLNTDDLATYANTFLGANSYGFPALPSANANTFLYSALTYENTTIGKISRIGGINPGQNYNNTPFVLVHDALVASTKRPDTFDLMINSVTSNFSVGEVITQDTTSGRGLVMKANTTVLTVQNLRYLANNMFQPGYTLRGDLSGATANCGDVYVSSAYSYMGLDAKINVSFTVGTGVVGSLDVVSSGFNFRDQEEVTFASGDRVGLAIARCGGLGKTKGYYADSNGFLSNRNKLRDGHYYQEYSYDIISPIQYNKYKDLLKQIMHVAGTKNFFTHVYSTRTKSSLNIRRVS